MGTRRISCSVFCMLPVVCLGASAACSAAHATGPRTVVDRSRVQTANAPDSVWSGVYTVAQAESGELSYRRHCAWCHGRRLEGDEDICAPPLVGPEFWKRWGGLSVGALYDRTRRTMPESKGGSLNDEEYAAIVSFVLQANECPAGPNDLPSELSRLARITITVRRSKS